MKLRRNPDGNFTEVGTEKWKRDDGALLSWRKQEERKRRTRERKKQRRAARKNAQPDTTSNPATGPPLD